MKKLLVILGFCSLLLGLPISALAQIENGKVHFKGNIVAVDGSAKVEIEKTVSLSEATELGYLAAKEILEQGGQAIADTINHAN